MGRFPGAIGNPFADGPASLDKHDLDPRPGLVCPPQNLGCRHGTAEAAAHHNNGGHGIPLPVLDLACCRWTRRELAEILERRSVHMDGHQQFTCPGRITHRMHAGIMSGQDLATVRDSLILQIDIAVFRDLVTALDRLALHHLHYAN